MRGFTFIEALAMIGVILLMALLVMPNLIARKKSNDVWAYRMELKRAAQDAHSKSIESGHVLSLQYDKSKKQIELEEESPNGGAQEVRHVDTPEGLDASSFIADQDVSGDDEWRARFYPDGTSSGGGIQFSEDKGTFSFTVSKDSGLGTIVDGPLPDLSEDHWSAGGYEPRS